MYSKMIPLAYKIFKMLLMLITLEIILPKEKFYYMPVTIVLKLL